LIFKIHGPILNPSITRISDGSTITLSGEVAAGNYLEISVGERTVKLNGTANAIGFLQPSLTNWAAFFAPPNPAGDTFTLAGTEATAAFMEVLYRSAYA
jgi:hypothetical protein